MVLCATSYYLVFGVNIRSGVVLQAVPYLSVTSTAQQHCMHVCTCGFQLVSLKFDLKGTPHACMYAFGGGGPPRSFGGATHIIEQLHARMNRPMINQFHGAGHVMHFAGDCAGAYRIDSTCCPRN